MTLKEYIELVEEKGTVLYLHNGRINRDDIDLMLKTIGKEAKYELYLLAEPYLVTRVHQMLDEINTTATSYGTFEKKTTALGFVPEVAFSRGSFHITLFQKSISGGVLIPTYPLNLEDMVKNSVRIRFNHSKLL